MGAMNCATKNAANLKKSIFYYNNVSLVKTRLRDSRRGEIPSTVGVRQPNPYENVRIFLECAIYQTHVIIFPNFAFCATMPALLPILTL